MQNGSQAAVDRPSFEQHARTTIQRAFSPTEGEPPEGWVRPLVMIGSGVIYALLEIARAIREK